MSLTMYFASASFSIFARWPASRVTETVWSTLLRARLQ